MGELTAWPIPVAQLHSETLQGYHNVLAARRLHREHFESGWATSEGDLRGLRNLAAFDLSHGTQNALLDDGDCMATVALRSGYLRVAVSAETKAQVDECVAYIRESFPEVVASDGEVPVVFWFYTPQGARRAARRIAVSDWAGIEGNYTKRTRELLGASMSNFKPAVGGQLILWQGDPGTGKTHALRALAWEWRDWADLHYVVDPDRLFGGDHGAADYLMEVLLDEDNGVVSSDDEVEKKQRWRVLILEDTGELLAADAKTKVGQGLSRLLNVVDGLIGQGLRVLVLVTTNEELKNLHPAVSRPGRCASKIRFDSLTPTEANVWLEANYLPASRISYTSLADLFAIRGGYAESLGKAVGFGA